MSSTDSSFDCPRQFWVQIEAQRMAAGYKPGWSYYSFTDRFGVAPIVGAGELVDPATATPEQKKAVYLSFLEVAQAKGFKPGWAAYRFRDTFGYWPRSGRV